MDILLWLYMDDPVSYRLRQVYLALADLWPGFLRSLRRRSNVSMPAANTIKQ